MENFKSFYLVVSRNSIIGGNWGKGTSLKSAITYCKLKKLTDKFIIYQAIVKASATDEEVQNLCQCFNINDLGGVSMYSNPSEEDSKMVKDFLLGWIINEDFFK